VPKIAALLFRNGFSKKDIDGFAVVSGPGSFTGLRVGLAAIKALAEVLGKPIAAVSLLEAVASAGGVEGTMITALDAGRQQVYVGEYEVLSGKSRRIKESILAREEFANMVREANVVTPISEIAALARNIASQVQIIAAPGISLIAEIGWKKILSRDTVLPESLEANYISRPHAKIFSKSGS
ncbi:MAG: tRNA (adenosine(37)-N6)-threonylcarbamoyltransferase complex dimerization subunit type 1 TsaB, partial [Terriglobales bacterium]